jgi:hypothetical protein
MKYDEEAIEKLYQENLTVARKQLALLQVAEGREPNIKGLNGWVYEQIIRYCILQELEAFGLSPIINEQVTLSGRAKIDLVVGKVAIEIKALGSFGNDAEKYKKYRVKVEERGWEYFYLTRSETYKPYRLEAFSTFGEEYAFFLDKKGDWGRFVREVKRTL